MGFTFPLKGIENAKPTKVINKWSRFQAVPAILGENRNVHDDVQAGMDPFTCALYCRMHMTSIGRVRWILIKEVGKSPDDSLLMK